MTWVIKNPHYCCCSPRIPEFRRNWNTNKSISWSLIFFFSHCLVRSAAAALSLSLCTLQAMYLFLISFFSLLLSLVLAQHEWQQLRMTLPSPWQPRGLVCVLREAGVGGVAERAEGTYESDGWRRREYVKLV